DSCEVTGIDGKVMASKAGIKVRNSGQTPAHNLNSWIGIGLHEYPLQQPLARLPDDHQRVISVLHPGDSKMQIVDWPTETVDSEAAEAGKVAVYFLGEVSYEDAFVV